MQKIVNRDSQTRDYRINIWFPRHEPAIVGSTIPKGLDLRQYYFGLAGQIPRGLGENSVDQIAEHEKVSCCALDPACLTLPFIGLNNQAFD